MRKIGNVVKEMLDESRNLQVTPPLHVHQIELMMLLIVYH